MTLTPQGKKIWDSRAGGDLAMAMMGEKPMTDEDWKTLEALKQISHNTNTSTQASPEVTKHKPSA